MARRFALAGFCCWHSGRNWSVSYFSGRYHCYPNCLSRAPDCSLTADAIGLRVPAHDWCAHPGQTHCSSRPWHTSRRLIQEASRRSGARRLLGRRLRTGYPEEILQQSNRSLNNTHAAKTRINRDVLIKIGDADRQGGDATCTRDYQRNGQGPVSDRSRPYGYSP
jgi:hypothetical protein